MIDISLKEIEHIESELIEGAWPQDTFLRFMGVYDIDAVRFEADHGQRVALPVHLIQGSEDLDVEACPPALYDLMSNFALVIDVYRTGSDDVIEGLNLVKEGDFIIVRRSG